MKNAEVDDVVVVDVLNLHAIAAIGNGLDLILCRIDGNVPVIAFPIICDH